MGVAGSRERDHLLGDSAQRVSYSQDGVSAGEPWQAALPRGGAPVDAFCKYNQATPTRKALPFLRVCGIGVLDKAASYLECSFIQEYTHSRIRPHLIS